MPEQLNLPGTVSHTSTEHSAVLSDDRKYRYELWRRWSDAPYCCFVGLNPSTANENVDDPTIRRCIRFAKDWGFGALCMVNLFAFRATEPSRMKSEPDPIGDQNDETLIRVTNGSGITIAAWGIHGEHQNRGVSVCRQLAQLHCLGTTKAGHPKHPLYLPGNSSPELFNGYA